MGSCGSGFGGIGPIVWVRRRNGSWWPGKILGPNELSECNLSSPRTGTPVKLLGREDASVDWYNLEKSKRVKAFRCGEFDECIEKAESAHGLPIKKREKYARREDAILHALELEKKLVLNGFTSSVATNGVGSKVPALERKVSMANNDMLLNPGHHKLTRFGQNFEVDLEIQDKVEDSKMEAAGTNSSPRSLEEDQSEAAPRMRELQDLGLMTALSKRKFECDSSRRNHHFPLNTGHTPDKIIYVHGVDQIETASRSKRSRHFHGTSRDPLDEKEFSEDQIGASPRSECSDFNRSSVRLKEINSYSVAAKDADSDYSQSDSLASDFDSSETEPDANYITASSDLDPCIQESTSIEEPDDSNDVAYPYRNDPYLSNVAVSKWQLKGKRNVRYRDYHRPYYTTRNGESASTFRRRTYNIDKVSKKNSIFTDWDDFSCENGRLHVNSKSNKRQLFGRRTKSLLVDVDLTVQSNYRRECVPIISLLSKVNEMAVVGNPIQVEVMEDGTSERIVLTTEHTGNPSLPVAWKNARRRNFRVPRSNVSTILGAEETPDSFHHEEHDRKSPRKKSVAPQNPSSMRKGISRNPRLLSSKKFSRNASRKASLSANQKTRTLSSIGHHQRFGAKAVGDVEGHPKGEISGPPTVACIPVKLVFSRLLEKINRPASKAVV